MNDLARTDIARRWVIALTWGWCRLVYRHGIHVDAICFWLVECCSCSTTSIHSPCEKNELSNADKAVQLVCVRMSVAARGTPRFMIAYKSQDTIRVHSCLSLDEFEVSIYL